MIIHTFGTCAGTQAVAGFHHTCLAVETEKGLYFIDAGENGAYAAQLSGVDLLKTRAVFITHPHMDHVGGLGNLLWYCRKQTIVQKKPVHSGNIDICCSCRDVFDATMLLLKNTEGDFVCDHTHSFIKVDEDFSYTSPDGELTASAVHTDHMPPKDGEYRSYAFFIRAQGKTLVFMGDMRPEDLDRVLPDRVDAVFVETGHYGPDMVAGAIKKTGKKAGKVFFVHHGKAIREDPGKAMEAARAAYDGEILFAEEGASYEL